MKKLNRFLGTLLLCLVAFGFAPEAQHEASAAAPCWEEGCAANNCYGLGDECVLLLCPDGYYVCFKYP